MYVCVEYFVLLIMVAKRRGGGSVHGANCADEKEEKTNHNRNSIALGKDG